MSSNMNLADLKTGGRLSAFADAWLNEQWAKAQAIASDLMNDVGTRAAIATGVLEVEVEEWTADAPVAEVAKPTPTPPKREPAAAELQSCLRGAHAYGPVDGRGWRTCVVCDHVNVTPPQ